MDEPTSSLSADEVRRLQKIIFSLKERGVSIIYISHLLDEVFEIADTIIVLRDGYFIESKPKVETSQREIVSLMVGEELMRTQNALRKEIEAGTGVRNDEIVMEVSGLMLTKESEPVGFALHKGEVLGITGLVGAGKTETLRAITGLDRHKEMKLILGGKEIRLKNMRDALQHGVCVVPEDRKLEGLILMRSVRENIAMCRTYRSKNSKMGVIRRKTERDDVAEMIEDLSIKVVDQEQIIRYLSGGNQQKCVIAK